MAQKETYDSLEDQIGDLGGENQPEGAPRSLGKIKHKEILGQQPDLDESEEKEYEAFKSKSRALEREAKIIDISGGWIPIDRAEMGRRSGYYPADWEFYIRPATVAAIRNWAAIDEENPDQVYKTSNEIIRTSVKIQGKDGPINWSHIRNWDRFWFILKIRELTFVNGETKIEFEDTCSECDSDITFTLSSATISFEYPDDDVEEKNFDPEHSVWKIVPKDYDVNYPALILYNPTIGKDDAILDWARQRVQLKQKIDEAFIRYLSWLLPYNLPRDSSAQERLISKAQKEYRSWDVNMSAFMDSVIRNIETKPLDKMQTVCPCCGQEVTSQVRFPNGIKYLFKVESTTKKFGSK